MSGADGDALRARLLERVGRPLGGTGRMRAPDAVNVPMIRHWVDAFDDRNPVYLDEARAASSRFGGIVAPPAMLQTWTMGRPRIEGIAERGGSAEEIDAESPIRVLAEGGYPGTLATNSELEFARPLRPGDRIEASTVLESLSERKATALGQGYFVTWVTSYADERGEVVGRQRFRILKFAPGSAGAERPAAAAGARPPREPRAEPAGEELPPFALRVTATRIVAGAIASRDFMPVHHDRDYANTQGAPQIFFNILSDTGYCSRFLTDWAGPDAMVKRLAIRLGVPAFAGSHLTYTGEVTAVTESDDEALVEIAFRAVNDMGEHISGTATLGLPA